MAITFHYWAVPPSSRLFERLLSDQAFITLMTDLFQYDDGIYFFFDRISDTEREKIFQWIIESRRSALGDAAEARRLIDAFRREVERTLQAWPGIEQRGCRLYKTALEIQMRMSEALRDVRDDADSFVGRIVNGDQWLGISGSPDPMDALNGIALNSSALVKEGARIIGELNGEALFPEDPNPRRSWARDWVLNDFKPWQRLYREAAAQGEALLVGVA
jgi:hypothetical protein